MSYTYYEFKLDEVLDTASVNSPQDMDYLAWQLGRDERNNKGIWLIEPIRDTTDLTLSELLPTHTTGTLLEDVQKYGYNRTFLPKLGISQLVARFTDTLNYFKAEVIAGHI